MLTNIKQQIEIAPQFSINTIMNGLWQLSGAHRYIKPQNALKAMILYHKAGLKTWDLADHYGFAEDLIGMYNDTQTQKTEESDFHPKFFTKWVPRPGKMTRNIVEQAVDRSINRMKVEKIDLLQFHWWDYEDENYIRALDILTELKDQGKITYLGLTNFDTAHLQQIMDHGIPVVSNQVQFSILDQRPLKKMAPFCEKHNIKLFTFGTLGGGLYTDRFLAQPVPSRQALSTASLQKYAGMIRKWGKWEQFQTLLETLADIAKKHDVSIANIAVRYVLEQPSVAGVIIGTRLSLSNHINETKKIYSFNLDKEDHERIQKVSQAGNDLFEIIGDTGDEYR